MQPYAKKLPSKAFTLSILAVVVSCISACSHQPAVDQPMIANVVTESNEVANTQYGRLLSPQAIGQIDLFGGARRVDQERSQLLKDSIDDAHAKNVILFIGDGTSDSEITIARNYLAGASGYLKGIDVLPFTASYTTYSIDPDGRVNYVTDSAASATAWATGAKSYNGALGIDRYNKVHQSLLEIAKANGLATGNVTTTEIQDATPASLYAHISARKCYTPEKTAELCPSETLQKGGLGSITEQLLKNHADITLGGGSAHFDAVATAGQYQGQSLLQQAKARGLRIVNNLKELQAVDTANQQQPVIGLFAKSHLPVIWTGPQSTLNGNKKPAIACQDNPEFVSGTPLLKEMTSKALALLANHPKGFFLQVESGSIDKQNHKANACGQIGETKQLDEAIQVGLEFAKQHGETLIIVTGDHAHTSQIIPTKANSPGLTIALKTPIDQSVMAVNYGTETGDSQAHTGAQVRIAAFGPRAANVTGLLDQTDLFFIIRDALNLPQNAK